MTTINNTMIVALVAGDITSLMTQVTESGISYDEIKAMAKVLPDFRRSLVTYVKDSVQRIEQEEAENKLAQETAANEAYMKYLAELESQGIKVTDAMRAAAPMIGSPERKARKTVTVNVQGETYVINGKPKKDVQALIDNSGLTREAFIEKYQVKEEA